VLALIDQAVVPILRISEAGRYESDVQVRFENSDLFLLGPLAEYLREHPAGRTPRVLFFGDSVVWGYQIKSHEAIPAAFQRLVPEARVLNFGVNGFTDGSAYLMSKAVIDGADAVYLFHHDGPADPLLPKVIDVSPEDLTRFNLAPLSPAERAFTRLRSCWRLSRYAYRLQGAWFGTSTRQCLYLHKGEWLRRLLQPAPPAGGRPLPPLAPHPEGRALWDAPVAQRAPAESEQTALAQRYPLLWDYATLLSTHQKHGAIIETSIETTVADEHERALLNVAFHPYVIFARVTIPDSWLQPDRIHLTPEGCRGIAELIAERTAGPFGLGRT